MVKTTTEKKDELIESITKIFKDIIGKKTSKTFAIIIIKYPATNSQRLLATLPGDPELESLSSKQIQSDLEELVQEGLFEYKDSDRLDFMNRRIREPVHYDDYSEYLHNWIKTDAPSKLSEYEKIKKKLKKWLDDYKEKRANRYANTIPIATSEKGDETYKRDLEPDKSTTELLIPAMSLDTQEDIIKEKVKEGTSKCIDFRILILGPELGREMERPRTKKEIKNGKKVLESLKEYTKNEPGDLKYRFIEDKEYAHFLGLLKKSSDEEENCYRIIVRRPGKERGDVSPVLRGKYRTTLFKILEKYFENAWTKGRKPGLQGFLEKNFKKLLLFIPVLALIIWYLGLIPGYLVTVLLAFTLPIAGQVLDNMLK